MSALNSLFPVQLHTHWIPSSQLDVDSCLADWLLDPTSLTARLKKHSHDFRVVVLGQRLEKCSKQDACEIIQVGSEILTREVILYCDDSAQVFARSLLPLASLTGEEQALATLGDKPLGQVIFSKANLTRTAIEVGRFNNQSSVAKLADKLELNASQEMWGRRSLFHVDDKPIVVAEVFLPNAFAYKKERELL
ncbi:chorismate--pyruvate lyase family protein [Thalassotalea atypica]|uniref:chorismate--pyruvate lyase family protein n=1 Tax=Thalassotalea atypica TaxID=2054316 RepID=UPI002572911F|nr:chorismate lyase [Thalassotalea atypica]